MGRGDEYQDNSIDIYAYFNTSCYSGYYDDDQVSYCRHSFSYVDFV